MKKEKNGKSLFQKLKMTKNAKRMKMKSVTEINVTEDTLEKDLDLKRKPCELEDIVKLQIRIAHEDMKDNHKKKEKERGKNSERTHNHHIKDNPCDENLKYSQS